ncbi:hypothetical protein TNCV_560961 [Trichonephila clavipes]|nr:hypothetical protein TNCV_560961 [Trichonephila clavipes]
MNLDPGVAWSTQGVYEARKMKIKSKYRSRSIDRGPSVNSSCKYEYIILNENENKRGKKNPIFLSRVSRGVSFGNDPEQRSFQIVRRTRSNSISNRDPLRHGNKEQDLQF